MTSNVIEFTVPGGLTFKPIDFKCDSESWQGHWASFVFAQRILSMHPPELVATWCSIQATDRRTGDNLLDSFLGGLAQSTVELIDISNLIEIAGERFADVAGLQTEWKCVLSETSGIGGTGADT